MRKVYILGAGASAGYDKSEVSLRSPTARDFFKRAMQLIDKNAIEEQRFHNLFLINSHLKLTPSKKRYKSSIMDFMMKAWVTIRYLKANKPPHYQRPTRDNP